MWCLAVEFGWEIFQRGGIGGLLSFWRVWELDECATLQGVFRTSWANAEATLGAFVVGRVLVFEVELYRGV